MSLRKTITRQRIYVSGPLSSSGNREENVKTAIAAGIELIRAGFAPLIPHMTHYVDPDDSLGHATWMEVDLPWVLIADAVLRLPGESRGADMETAFASENSIPIYDSIDALKAKPPGRGDARFHAILRRVAAMHCRKAADYGTDADLFSNIRASAEYGIPPHIGAMVRMNDKVTRLKTYALKRELANESVEDSLLDIAAYAIISLILKQESA